jgi:hypothetical protein
MARWEETDRTFAAGARTRADVFRALHERTRELFLDSPGAGSGRVFVRTDESILLMEDRDWSYPPQPGPPADFPDSPGESLAVVPADAEFHELHAGWLFDFLFPDGFGYVRDRDHVAGFRSHGFRFCGPLPFERRRWELRHVQLVGMLGQSAPVVYMTDRLPSMDQVRQGKTRAPDPFETAGLAALGGSEDLYLAQRGDTVRMLGAVRATRVCQQCHEAAIGDLLGALSYTLDPAGTPAAKGAAEPRSAPDAGRGER